MYRRIPEESEYEVTAGRVCDIECDSCFTCDMRHVAHLKKGYKQIVIARAKCSFLCIRVRSQVTRATQGYQ